VIGHWRRSEIDHLTELHFIAEAEGSRAAGKLAGQIVELGIISKWREGYNGGGLKRGLRGIEYSIFAVELLR